MSSSQPMSSARDQSMPPAYDPRAVEAAWQARWEAARLFRADARSTKPKYSIAIPPPNVTGELHMGHATVGTLEDVWVRYRRMTGHEVLWLPGTDHAAIATQNVIERQLANEGTSKEELGREKFNARVQRWYEEVGETIISQFRELGAALDFSRLRFTMDPAYVRAVRTAFVRYYDKGLLYRGPRIVNWCPRCQSAISDLEVDWQVHEDVLYTIAYDVEGGVGTISIATVRPETMLADTGVAVHPLDARYKDLVGKHAMLPLVGRRLPIVADEAVQREFGTGALKVTPGHDALDWEIGERHGLEVVNALHLDGRMNVPDLPRYDGLPVSEARALVVQDLRQQGRVQREEPYRHEVGHCDRCGWVIEPLVSEQWFLRMKGLARMCIEASERREVRWHPERFERTYLDWLHGIRDWCVSRQLWLGHRIPVYTCALGHRVASVDPPVRCPECGSLEWTEDSDVLDTWFSSALWPFATVGWPDDTEDLRTFYPTALNVTAREIINLWVTRMIFSGLEFMGQVPFRDVMINATILAADGRRMSKSLGTGVDPRDIIQRHGADALRAWAALVGTSTQDVRFDETGIQGFARFANKLWNATRPVLNALGDRPAPALTGELHLVDRWILSRLQATIRAATDGIEGYNFRTAVSAIYDFAWHDYCDWYLEAVKSRLRGDDGAAKATLHMVHDTLLRLLHPFMPFVTEELWHRLPGDRDFLIRAQWPEADPRFDDSEAEADLARVQLVVEEIRRARKAARGGDRGGRVRLEGEIGGQLSALIAELARVELVRELATEGLALAEAAARAEFPAAGDVTAERHRELARHQTALDRVESKLANPDFLARAPAAVVEKERARLAELRAAIDRLASN